MASGNSQIPEWVGAALFGAFIITVPTSVGMVALLLEGQPVQALLLLVVCILSGGAAGVVHCFTVPWARRSRGGAYLHGIAVVETYFFVAIGCALLGALIAGENIRTFGNMPTAWMLLFLAVAGLIFGLLWGHWEFKEQSRSGQA